MKYHGGSFRRLEQLHKNKETMHVGKVYIDRFARWILIYFQIGFMQAQQPLGSFSAFLDMNT